MIRKKIVPNLRFVVAAVAVTFLSVFFFSPRVGYSAGVRWHNYDEGVSLGKQEQKKLFVFFWATWCGYCERMEKETLNDPEIAYYLNENYIAVKVNSDTEQETAAKYFVRGLPTCWFLGEQGEKISNLPGYVAPDMFLSILKYIHSDSYKKISFKEFLDARK